MMELVEFLLARIAEYETIARAANGPRWRSGDGDVSEGGLYAMEAESDDGWAIAWFELGTANEAPDGGRQLPRWPKMERHAHENSVHAARHDPAHVLTECEAKRRIVDLHKEVLIERRGGDDFGIPYDALCDVDSDDFPCPTLRLLALPYADHPDFNPEWRI